MTTTVKAATRPGALVLALLSSALALGAPAAPAPQSPILHGQWQPVVLLRAGVFSIALGNQIQQAPSLTGRPGDSPFLMRSLGELAPPVLRLPGGDGMNTWSWVKGRGETDHSGRTPAMRADDYLKLCAAAQATPLWGVNVTTAAPAETEALARTLVREKGPASLFELGNELYLQRWAGMAKTAAIYAQKAAPHAEVLRKYFPKAKLGVPLASYWGLDSVRDGGGGSGFRWKKPGELAPWILDMAKRQDFYDAVVLHLYLVPTELGRNGLATHTADEVRRWAWVRSDARQVQDLFGLVHGVFPAKDIWVTEWAFNSTQYIGPNRKDVRYQVHQTMLAALYNARFMLNTAYYVPYVPIMTIWTLYEQPAVALLKGEKTGINYDLFLMLRQAREGADGLARLELSNAPRVKGPSGPQGFDRFESPAADVFGFYRGDKLRSVMILNSEPQALTVEIPRLRELGTKSGEALTSPEMLPDWGNPANPSPDNWRPPYERRDWPVEGGAVTVPPNSLSIVRGRG